MLVCAPTGAGKTNIAMLTILHQIKQYITNGVLERKDQFKVKVHSQILLKFTLTVLLVDCVCGAHESFSSRDGREFRETLGPTGYASA